MTIPGNIIGFVALGAMTGLVAGSPHARLPAPNEAPPTLESPAAEPRPQPVVERPLAMITSPGLSSGYRLAVVEVPDPPADVLAPSHAPVAQRSPGVPSHAVGVLAAKGSQSSCPFELRAVVGGEEDTFAIIASNPPGASPEDSPGVLVRAGDEVKLGELTVRVRSIQSKQLNARVAGRNWQCALTR